MRFSFSSLFNVTLACCILTIVILLLLRSNRRLARFGTTFAVAISSAVILRFLVPVEFPFTKSIYEYKCFYSIYHFLIDDFTAIGSLQISICDILLAVWIIGIIVRLITVASQYTNFYKFCFACPSLKNELILKTFSSVHEEMGKYKRFYLVHSDLINTPMIFGIFKPFIIIPTLNFNEEDWGYILKHELTHYYRGHLFCKLLCEIMCCLYWWNPAVYLFRAFFNILLEMDVDTKITRSLSSEKVYNYLFCLSNVAKFQLQRHKPDSGFPWAISFISIQRRYFMKRCKFILDCLENKEERNVFPMVALGATMTAFLLASVLIIIEPSSRPEDIAIELNNDNLWSFSQEGCFLLQEGCFLLQEEPDTYVLYVHWISSDTYQDITFDDPNIRVYSSLEEAYENETKK